LVVSEGLPWDFRLGKVDPDVRRLVEQHGIEMNLVGEAAAFNLGNMLRACGRDVEAEAALQAATGIDPAFAEAWYNLSDLLDDQGRYEAAIECLRKSLQAAPDYVDALFNLALLLQRKNEYAEVANYWRRFLVIESRSEWATRARRSLKFCEIQQHLIA
jgi:tetratricopeptide (TPR) repeat protein